MSIAGKYELVSSENFEDYLKAIGVGLALRKLGGASKPTIIITEDGDNYTMKTITTFKTIDLAYTIEKEFVEDTADGRQCNTIVRREGNKLIQTQTLNNESTTITRQFTPEGMNATFEAAGIVSKRVFRRV